MRRGDLHDVKNMGLSVKKSKSLILIDSCMALFVSMHLWLLLRFVRLISKIDFEY